MKAAILVMFFALSAFAHEEHHHENMDGVAPQKLNGESVYNLHTEWTSQDDSKFHLEQLRGHPVVLVMLYTSCQSACPILISDVKKIGLDLSSRQKDRVHFLVVSLDPTRDTSSQLKTFATKHKLDLGQWTLLHGKEAQIRELANVIGVKFKKEKSGDYSHSNVISILNTEGIVRYQQLGLGGSDKDTISILETL